MNDTITTAQMADRHPNTKHGMRGTPVYKTWAAIKSRCISAWGKRHPRYGGRGIKVCKRWADSFEAFYVDMGERPDGTTLDRIDNSGDYKPGNCRWATRAEQGRNTRTNVFITAFNETKTMVEWIEDQRCVVGKSTLQYRIQNGWDGRAAITKASRNRKGKA